MKPFRTWSASGFSRMARSMSLCSESGKFQGDGVEGVGMVTHGGGVLTDIGSEVERRTTRRVNGIGFAKWASDDG